MTGGMLLGNTLSPWIGASGDKAESMVPMVGSSLSIKYLPHYQLYLRFSRMALEIYAEYTDFIEPFGLDEAWIDVTSSGVFGDAVKIAETIRNRVKFELGITVSIGVSFNKIFAKLGSDYKKPDAVTVFRKDDYREKVWLLPLEELLYVGPATTRKLRAQGIRTIGDLARTDPSLLDSWLGKIGYVLHPLC